MLKTKALAWSIFLFIIMLIGSSLFYMLYDFMNNDVAPNVKVFGKSQLVITALVILFLAVNEIKPKCYFTWGFCITCGLVLIIQIVPAFLWFLFNGEIVADSPFDNGVTGHWLFGVIHLLIIVWGLMNIVSYNKSGKG